MSVKTKRCLPAMSLKLCSLQPEVKQERPLKETILLEETSGEEQVAAQETDEKCKNFYKALNRGSTLSLMRC